MCAHVRSWACVRSVLGLAGQPFQFGLNGSAVLSKSLQQEEGVPRSRIFEREGEPPRPVRELREGACVRVQMEDTASRPSVSTAAVSARSASCWP